ncbi:MAG: transposase [Candidatus Taylorbacteria bacterium]
MLRKFDFSIGEFYHLYTRGTEKRKIFLDQKDYLRFMVLLSLCNSKESIHLSDHWKKSPTELFALPKNEGLVDIGAYCLMPNHTHILVHERIEGGISSFAKKIFTSYSMYINKKYHRTGGLFESRFKAKHLNSNEYLKYQFAYIHLNPIKLVQFDWKEKGIIDIIGAKKFLEEYRYSSYQDYIGVKRPENIILTKEAFPDYFSEDLDFEEFVSSWLNFKEDEEV